jgi:hypothetical protein
VDDGLLQRICKIFAKIWHTSLPLLPTTRGQEWEGAALVHFDQRMVSMLERSMWGSSGVSNGFEFIRVDMVMDVCMIHYLDLKK